MTQVGDLRITERGFEGRVAVLQVEGRLDALTAPRFLETCNQVQARGLHLVLDLARVSFLGSSGVGALLVLVEQARERDGTLHLVALSDAARGVIDLLDLSQYLAIHASERDALAAMRS
jgi:stage II sporulation protein AA (anti-sigma F factor antagonist)